jgi:cobalt-zinc-cadmium efflux system membrane fusion protein
MLVQTTLLTGCVTFLAACGVGGSAASGDGAPPPAVVEHDGDASTLHVEHPERFPLATATSHQGTTTLTVTGVVSPDISRAVPVVSLSSGRVIELRASLGDRVEKGQVLLRIQSADVSAAIADHRKARVDDVLARTQLERAKDLYERGAIAKKDLEVAQDAADKATVDVENSAERLRVLGVDPSQTGTATGIVSVVAPASGVITEQNVTNAAGVKTLDNSPNLFTVSDLSRVWIICDVYENDLPAVRVGDTAEIHLAAYPDRALSGRVNNIASILDPSLRTAKIRIEVANPGLLRIGMFVTAAFHGQTPQVRAVVPATAILHLHDRDWVYIPAGTSAFQRQEVVGGQMLSGNMQEVVSGLQPGARVIANALVFQNTSEQ